jgi:hypothetical protein
MTDVSLRIFPLRISIDSRIFKAGGIKKKARFLKTKADIPVYFSALRILNKSSRKKIPILIRLAGTGRIKARAYPAKYINRIVADSYSVLIRSP